MLSVMLAAGAVARAEAGRDEPNAAAPSATPGAKTEAPKTPGGAAPAEAEKQTDAPEVPVKVYVAGTPEDPYIVARIGEFPEKLGESGKEFLKREFIEHFIKDVMGLGAGGRAEVLKIALLPQEDVREQECSFSLGEVAGRITVRLAERHVFILVSLDPERTPVPTIRAPSACVVTASARA